MIGSPKTDVDARCKQSLKLSLVARHTKVIPPVSDNVSLTADIHAYKVIFVKQNDLLRFILYFGSIFSLIRVDRISSSMILKLLCVE